MSLITRCPACTTLFKVVPDQLRVSEGWVRCGQCDEVFDATAHLQGEKKPEPSPLAESPAGSVPGPRPLAAKQATAPPAPSIAYSPVHDQDQDAEQDPLAVDTVPQMPLEPDQAMDSQLAAQLDWPVVVPAPVYDYDPVMDIRPGAAYEPPTASKPAPAIHLDLPEPAAAKTLPPAAPAVGAWARPTTPAPAPDPAPPEHRNLPNLKPKPRHSPERAVPDPLDLDFRPSTWRELEAEPKRVSDFSAIGRGHPTFMRADRSPSWWAKPWVRGGLGVVSLLLVAGLLLQFTVHERDRLAANVPELRPALTALCSHLHCKILPFRQIESIVIDSSSFVKVRGDVYRLNITLKNTAPLDLAAPAVELTLTDLQDQPLIRRVVTPIELGAPQGVLVAGAELVAGLPISVKTLANGERINGYRLLAFYP